MARACSAQINNTIIVNTQNDNVQTSQKEALERVFEESYVVLLHSF